MYVVVVVVPVQRCQHLVLQLDGQDLLLITDLEGKGAMKHLAPVGTWLRWQWAALSAAHQLGFLQSSLINYHCRVLQWCWEWDAEHTATAALAHHKTDAVAGDILSCDIPPGWVTLRYLCPQNVKAARYVALRGKGALPGATQARRDHPQPHALRGGTYRPEDLPFTEIHYQSLKESR